MKSLFKKAVCMACAVMLAVSAAACGGKEENSTDQGGQPAQQTTQQTAPAPEKVTFYLSNNTKEVPSVNDVMQIPAIKHIADKTNTILDIQFLEHNKYNDNLRMKFASGEYPDAWMAWSVGDREEVAQGLNADLTDLVNQFGPNLKQNIPQVSWDSVTLGGKIQAIPVPQEFNVAAGRVFYVRKDWMDKVGIRNMPGTSDEFLDLLRAFRDRDPNGNGQQDEIPFTARQGFSWLEGIFNMWGITPFNFNVHDGKVMPGFAAPDMKKALEFMATMYKEKLIDSEFLSANTGSIWSNKINSDKAGVWFHMSANGGTWQNDVQNALPDVKVDVSAMPCPRGKDYTGPVGYIYWPVSKTYFIYKDSKVKEATMRVFDWLATEEGIMFSKYGFEGETLIKQENGKYKYDPEKEKELKTEWREVCFKVAELDSVYEKMEQDPVLWPKKMAALEVAKNEGVPNPVFALPVPKAYLTDTEMTFGGKLIQEAMARIVFGEKPVGYWDEIMDKWYQQGGEDIVKEATDSYTKNIGK